VSIGVLLPGERSALRCPVGRHRARDLARHCGDPQDIGAAQRLATSGLSLVLRWAQTRNWLSARPVTLPGRGGPHACVAAPGSPRSSAPGRAQAAASGSSARTPRYYHHESTAPARRRNSPRSATMRGLAQDWRAWCIAALPAVPTACHS